MDGAQIVYNVMGYPTKYKGNTFTWRLDRKLISGTMNGKSFSYNYDGNGMRYVKNANGVKTSYYYNGTQLLMESKNKQRTWYIYGVTGIEGMIVEAGVREEIYYFDKNTLGDVVALRDTSGNIVATYEYDAWGNCTVMNANGTLNTSATFIGNVNPIRYRSYYYDTETGFYYLQTRYYDPTICRFINADNYELVAQLSSSKELNMYAYCANNPIMYTDPTGQIAGWLLAIIGVITSGVISGAYNVMAKNESESVLGAFVGGFVTGVASAMGLAVGLATGSIGGVLAATVIGGAGGFAGSAVGQVISYGNIDIGAAALNAAINAITTGFSAFGLALSGLYAGGSWMSRFMKAAGISEVGVGISIFFSTQNLPNPNDYRGRLKLFWLVKGVRNE